MPEGDSVWRTGRRLNRGLAGQLIVRSDFRVAQHATADVAGRRLLDTQTHGKHLFTHFDGDLTLHTHLRMDGEWTVLNPGKRLPARLAGDVRVSLAGENGQLGLALRMPVVELMTTQQEQGLRAALGPDPLRHDWDPAEAERRLRAAGDRPLVAALLDQRNLAGLGNLWVNELLFVRGLYPWTPAADADLAPVVRLAARMLRQSITVRGNGQVTTGNPRAGYEHWVYGRSGQSCRRCLTPVRHTPEVPGDPARRATWWCPHCQPAPDRV